MMLNRRTAVLLAALALVAAACGNNNGTAGSGSANPSSEIKLGVPVPTTGTLAPDGKKILDGIQYATDQLNSSGGLLGKKINLSVEDTQGQPSTAAAAGLKLVTQDKVAALVGGFGSTADYAMLQSIAQYKPLFVHAGSSSTKIEDAFGSKPWYYHVYIWDPARTEAATTFLNTLQPKPQSIAIVHEDGQYGSTAATSAEKAFTAAGYKVILNEPFKTGTADLTPVLSKVKGADILYFFGYSGDNIQMGQQLRSLNISPKLAIYTPSGEQRSDFGAGGVDLVGIDTWAAQENIPGLDKFVSGWKAAHSGASPVGGDVQGYTAMMTLADAIRQAGSTDVAKVEEILGKAQFDTPYGKVSYHKVPSGATHQLIDANNMVAIQFRPSGQDVVFPGKVASGKLVYPQAK